MHVWRITLSHLSCCVKYRKTWRLLTQTCKFNLVMLKLIHHTKSNHTCNMEREGEAVWSKGGLGSSCNPMFGSPWLRFSSSEHPGCRMLCIRPACGKLLALSMLCLPPLWECFYWKDNRPCRANSLIPDPSPQTVQDTSWLHHCPWKPNFTYNMTHWISTAHVTALSFICAFLT